MKICSKCKLDKELQQFPKSNRYKTGYNPICKQCINTINKIYRNRNLQQFKNNRKQYYQKNINKMRLEKRRYYETHKEQKSNYDIIYRENNKTKIANYKKLWEQNLKNDPIFKIKRNLRRRIHHAIKDNYKSLHTFELIGCTPEEFKKHIESQFQPGMSWNNYNPSGWHIDHIIPCHKFDLSDIEQQKKCFQYSNQRPLWAKDNLKRPRNN